MNKKSLSIIIAMILVVVVGIVLLVLLKPQNAGQPFSSRPSGQTPPLQATSIPTVKVQGGNLDVKLQLGTLNPKRFSVKAGSQLTLTVISADVYTHVFKFVEPRLQNVFTSVDAGGRQTITFTVPSQKGEYVFYCDVPGHRGRGEEGVMVVE